MRVTANRTLADEEPLYGEPLSAIDLDFPGELASSASRVIRYPASTPPKTAPFERLLVFADPGTGDREVAVIASGRVYAFYGRDPGRVGLYFESNEEDLRAMVPSVRELRAAFETAKARRRLDLLEKFARADPSSTSALDALAAERELGLPVLRRLLLDEDVGLPSRALARLEDAKDPELGTDAIQLLARELAYWRKLPPARDPDWLLRALEEGTYGKGFAAHFQNVGNAIDTLESTRPREALPVVNEFRTFFASRPPAAYGHFADKLDDLAKKLER